MMAILIMAMTMSGCGSDKNAVDQETYIFLGVHDHQKQVSLDGFNDALLEQCKIPENRIYLIAIDGEPYQVNEYKIPEEGLLLLPSQKEAAAKDYRNQIVDDFKKAVALSDEVAYTKAFEDLGNNIKPNTKYNVIIEGTGLDTIDALNFTKNLLLYDPEDVISVLKENDMIPNLHGVKSVSWHAFGNVDGSKQKSLSNKQYNQFVKFWKKYLITAGVDEKGIHFYKGKDTKTNVPVNSAKLPKVTPVVLPEIDPYQNKQKDDRLGDRGAIVNDKQFGGFVPDTADFLDQSKAEALAKSLAKEMRTGKWIVCGFTASDIESEKTRSLSMDRAKSVCHLLKQNGVKSSQLIALGGGTGNGTKYHTPGLGVGEEAQKNRITVIVNPETTEGKKLLKEYGQDA